MQYFTKQGMRENNADNMFLCERGTQNIARKKLRRRSRMFGCTHARSLLAKRAICDIEERHIWNWATSLRAATHLIKFELDTHRQNLWHYNIFDDDINLFLGLMM
jgi:hypothetical protein